MSTLSHRGDEYNGPTAFAISCGHPAFDEPDFTYSDDEMNRAMDEIIDDQLTSKADAIARAEIADAKAWLKTLVSGPVSFSRIVTDSDILASVSTSYMVAVMGTPYLYGHGATAMDAARSVAGQLDAAKVA